MAVIFAAFARTKKISSSRNSAAAVASAWRKPAIVPLFIFTTILTCRSFGQQESVEFGSLSQIISNAPVGIVDWHGNVATATNGFFARSSDTLLTADSGTYDYVSGEVRADGHVRIEQTDMLWVGENINYNFKTHQMHSEQFRAGRPPVFVSGKYLQGDITNKTYTARKILVTTDDVNDPAVYIRASRFRIVPGKYIEAWNAVLYLDGVPAFYFPYYKRNLGAHANNLSLMPGFRTAYGPYLLATYTWWLDDELDGAVHLDYRERRGVGAGPDLNLHLNRWGDASFKYYYLHDQNPYLGTNGLPGNFPIPQNRQRFYFGWQATPFTNLNIKSVVNYQSDPLVLHDFFESSYTKDPQPVTFIEANKYWNNWSLDALSTPRINNFFDQVERVPDVKLTGWRQQIFNTPLYYESESSAGYYRRMFAGTNSLFAGTNGLNYAAARADTFQQILLPYTFFGWLNVTPRAGGRFTYYSHETGPGGTNSQTYRKIFNTGVDISFKASRLWTGATNSLLQIDGLRHIVEPSISYAFVPRPGTLPPQLPQFDSLLPSPLLLPIQLPDYNDIDSIDTENVVRFGLRNTLQTKRNGEIEHLLDWNVLLDWRLHPRATQQTFNDLYSELEFRPRSWLTLESQTRYDINNGHFNLAYHQATFAPNEWWSWGIGHEYTRAGFVDNGDNLISSTMFFRANDNWGFRTEHDFNAANGRLQQQFYTIYRDMRSWTGALTFRVTDNGVGPKDYTVAFSFSVKAHPKHALGSDAVEPYHLVGE